MRESDNMFHTYAQLPFLLPNHLTRSAHSSRTVALTKTGTLLWSVRSLLSCLPLQVDVCYTRISLPGELPWIQLPWIQSPWIHLNTNTKCTIALQADVCYTRISLPCQLPWIQLPWIQSPWIHLNTNTKCTIATLH